MLFKELSQSKQSALNIIAAVVVVIINTCISFFLSPFIVEHLGIEANGYITLANNFVSYFVLIFTALDSMAGRFMLIEVRRNNYKAANEYYSSVLFGDWILGAVLLIPILVIIIYIDSFIQINTNMVNDVRILFALVFASFYIGICLPHWSNATYTTNKLYLRSLKSIITAVIRAMIIYFSYLWFPPHAFYVAIAGVIIHIIGAAMDYYYKIKLLPRLKVSFSSWSWPKVKEMIFSGIWNTVSQCGNILLEGIDVLIANLFIDPIASGVLALSKTIPNMITQVVGTITTTFGPRLTQLFADNDYEALGKEVDKHIKLIALIANIPIGFTIILGTKFYGLWVPSQDAVMLNVLSTLTLIGMIFSGEVYCINNIFTALNKLRINSLVIILTGLLNAGIVCILLKTTSLGVYAIAGVSSLMTIVRIFVFSAPYAAKCLHMKWNRFVWPLLKGGVSVVIPIGVSLLVKYIIPIEGWIGFFAQGFIAVGIIAVIEYFLLLKENEREILKSLLKKKRQ